MFSANQDPTTMTRDAIAEELHTHVAELPTWPLALALMFVRAIHAATEGDPSVAKHVGESVAVVDAPVVEETPAPREFAPDPEGMASLTDPKAEPEHGEGREIVSAPEGSRAAELHEAHARQRSVTRMGPG